MPPATATSTWAPSRRRSATPSRRASDEAIRRALAKAPDERQASALELAAAFRAALRAEPHEQLRAAALQWEDRASPDGALVAAGSRDGTLQVWQADSGALRSQLNPRRSKVLAVEFDPTSAMLLAAHADGTVVVADIAQGVPIAVLDGPRNALRTASFGPRGRVVGASRDGTARVWDAGSLYRQWGSDPMSDDCGIIIGAQPDGRFVAIGCGTRPTRIWDTANDRLLAELPSVTPIADGGYTSAFPAVSTGGDRAAIVHGDAVELYELPGGRLLRRIRHGAPVSTVAFAGAGRDLVSGAVDGSILVTRDDGTDRTLQASAGIDVAELLPDGRVVASDAERRLRVFRPRQNMMKPGALPNSAACADR
jgi:WD40 repeat protein